MLTEAGPTRCKRESSFYELASERAYKIELYTPVIGAAGTRILGYFEYYLSVAGYFEILSKLRVG